MGISADSIESHGRFRKACSLSFPLLADPDRKVIRQYDVRRAFGLGTSRVTYLIDKRGIVRGAFHHEVRINRHARDVLKALESLSRREPA